MKDESKTHFVKRQIYKYLSMNSDSPVRLADIREYIINNYKVEFSPGVFSSAIRDLIDEEGRIINIDRGVYMFVKSTKKLEINTILDDAIDGLREAAFVNYLEVDDLDVRYIKEIPNLIEKLQEMKIEY